MPTPLTRQLLDSAGCSVTDCGHDHSILYLHSACHTEAGTRASYHKDTGLLSINCIECDQLVVQLKVAKE